MSLIEIKTKKCCRCKAIKPINEFYKCSSTKDGYKGHCIDCSKVSNKLMYNNNKENYCAKAKEYYQRNRERIKSNEKVRVRKWYSKNKEKKLLYWKEYYDKNRDKILESRKEYNDKNRDKIQEFQLQYHRKYREVNSKKLKEYRKEYNAYQRDNLTDYYVGSLVTQNTFLSYKQIPKELIENWRLTLQIKREVKQLKSNEL